LEHVLDTALPVYALLVDAGIIHLTPESAAAKVAEVWDDVSSWWLSPSVQEARSKFCEAFARTSETPVDDLVRLLTA
ncbi:MAG TPA: transferase, partial [Leptospiraceae bacterium]|nr:transferase [Leptospiraceae bacterium]